MKTLEDVQTLKGRKVVDPDGDRIGTIDEIYLDRHTGEPAWATVKTGVFGLKSSYVPITDADISDDEVRVPFQKELVKDAPRIGPEGELTPEDERRLWEHYGRSDYDEWQGDDRTTALGLPDESEDARRRDDTLHGGGDRPAIVGVRLRRYIVVVPAGDAADREPR